ncbi:hypothetical protein ACJIZ3_013631 [Penstemon smallii]|uniref:Uncharacterized protein n=1 Tax=Penstemon smallii TaxID=265156 RepID=A0ABD3RHN6_9LAMI
MQSISIPARDLQISHVENPACWTQTSYHGALPVPELLEVWWLHVMARVNATELNKQTRYAAYLVFELNRPENLEKASAFVTFGREITDSSESQYFVFLEEEGTNPGQPGPFSQRRPDEWMEIKLGEVYNNSGDDGVLKICFWEKNTDKRKCGFIVRAIELRLLIKHKLTN